MVESNRTCLCVIFNHAFTENIPLLREIYAERFSEIRFIIPLKRMPDPDVITVYRGSYTHNAYVTDALTRLPLDCARYLFVHDDVLLRPSLNESNLAAVFGLEEQGDAFIGHLQYGPEDLMKWGHWLGPLWRLLAPRNFLSGTGVESLAAVLRELPPLEFAIEKLSPYGGKATSRFSVAPYEVAAGHHGVLANFRSFPNINDEDDRALKTVLIKNLFLPDPDGNLTVEIPYPFLIAGPSADLYIVERSCIDEFAHYSGLLAAAGVFVEIALPTALGLAAGRMVTAPSAGVRLEWSASWLPFDEVVNQMQTDAGYISAHPVKLSTVADKAAMLAQLNEARSWRIETTDTIRAEVEAVAPGFDADIYLAVNPDVKRAGLPAHWHYLNYGISERRRWR